jgi:hypothetical protein
MEELKTALNTLVQTSHEKAAAEHKLITDITDPAMRNAVLEWRKKA